MGTWTIPFTDVPSWAVPYVGYAYEHKYTNGTSATTFGGDSLVNATQYLTLALRALGYTSGEDFAWDSAWTLTDQLGITSGQYSADSAFTRGDVVLTSSAALDAPVKGSSQTLLEVIQTEVVSPAPSPTPDPQPEPQPAPQPEPDYSQSGNIPPDTIPGDDYVLNLHTMKFHYPSCRDVAKIADENRHDYTGTRETLLKYGYDSCGHCNP